MRVTAIIPAYNEEERIGTVLEAVKSSKLVDEIIVVDDGSEDNTAEAAKKLGVRVIVNDENLGKGGALCRGLEDCQADIILFLDADLCGLKTEDVDHLLLPVISGEWDMTIGVFSNGRLTTDLAQKVAPFLSGQRAIKRQVLEGISGLEISRYGVEVALTRYVKKNNIRLKEVHLENVSHVMKEEKLGIIRGFAERLRMYRDIVKVLSIKER
jgi:glycosyltransferase involved in cell wall biosynthesis